MSNGNVGVVVSGYPEIEGRLKQLPEEVRDEVLVDGGNYIKELMRKYPRQKYVSRKRAYGVTFFSDKQRRWFFAALNEGSLKIPYPRTQRLANAWQVLVDPKEVSIYVGADVPYAHFVMGEPGEQSRHAAKIGWKSPSYIVKQNATRIMKRIVRAANRAIGKIGGRKISF